MAKIGSGWAKVGLGVCNLRRGSAEMGRDWCVRYHHGCAAAALCQVFVKIYDKHTKYSDNVLGRRTKTKYFNIFLNVNNMPPRTS